jgi:LysM repeat protein
MTQQLQSISQPGQQSAAPMKKEHVVVAGETVEQIAKKYDVPAKYVRQLNKLSGPVQPGQMLRIPLARTAVASAPRPAATLATATVAKTPPAPIAPTPTGTTPGATR